MRHGQNTIDFLQLVCQHPDGLTIVEITTILPIMKNHTGKYALVNDGYLDRIKKGSGNQRNDLFKITQKGRELIQFYKDHPERIMKARASKNTPNTPDIEPQLYHDPVAQKYIEDMAKPVAWSSSLSSALRDIYLLSQNLLNTEDPPQGESDLDKHNAIQLLKIQEIDKIASGEGA
ncbi:MAG: hypothetical protein V3U84_02140 [Thiotrichaceae bacterium]